jgi:hypothetical protein
MKMDDNNIICKATNQPCSNCTYSCENKAGLNNTNKKIVDYIIENLNNRNNEFDYVDKLDFIRDDIEFILKKVDEYNKKGIN